MFIYPWGGSRVSKWVSVRNTMIIFLLSGLWHGANWTFVVWGVYHGALFLPLLLFSKNKRNRGTIVAEGRIFPSLKETMQMLVTFVLVMFGWIIFRADSIMQAIQYISNIFSVSLFSVPKFSVSTQVIIQSFFGVILMMLIEWLNRSKRFGLDLYGIKISKVIRLALYLLLALIIFYFGGSGQVFIYNQF